MSTKPCSPVTDVPNAPMVRAKTSMLNPSSPAAVVISWIISKPQKESLWNEITSTFTPASILPRHDWHCPNLRPTAGVSTSLWVAIWSRSSTHPEWPSGASSIPRFFGGDNTIEFVTVVEDAPDRNDALVEHFQPDVLRVLWLLAAVVDAQHPVHAALVIGTQEGARHLEAHLGLLLLATGHSPRALEPSQFGVLGRFDWCWSSTRIFGSLCL